MNIITNNKSRPEQPFVFVDDDYKNHFTTLLTKKRSRSTVKSNDTNKRSKSKKKYSPLATSKQNKYFPGEYIYDTKGQMAEIKYIGQCHKGSGIWFGIEFVDGTLGKHNGTINGHTYFRGEEIRCDMIRGDKIRSKAPGPHKYKSSNKRRIHHKRAKSDLIQTESLTLALSCNLSDNYFDEKHYKAKKKHKHKHKRHASQPTHVSDNYMDSVPMYHRKKNVKKEKYKGNKYILAMEQQTEKRKNERIGLIKTEKRRVKQQKHERNSSKVQEILKRKELEKEQLLRLNEEHKLKELERIHAAKQKSKKVNRIRSSSNCDTYDYNIKHKKNKISETNVNADRSGNKKNKVRIDILIGHDEDQSLPISTTPLVDVGVEFNLTPIPSSCDDSGDDKLLPQNVPIDCDKCASPAPINRPILSMPIDSVSPKQRKKSLEIPDHISSQIYPLNDENECDNGVLFGCDDKGTEYWIKTYNKMNEIERQIKEIDNISRPSPTVVNEDLQTKTDEKNEDLENKTKENEEEDYYFPMSSGNTIKHRSQSLSTPSLLKRAESAPIIVNDDKGTDYWIKQYNKANKKKSKRKSISKSKRKSISKSKQKKSSRSKTVSNLAKRNKKIIHKPENKIKTKTKQKVNNPFFTSHFDEISDIFTNSSTTLSTISTMSNDLSLDSLTIGSTISSIISSPSTSAESTPNNNSNNDNNSNNNNQTHDFSFGFPEMNNYLCKYGVYPFKRTHEQYINRRFTGIVRIGHRYLLRDGRIGVVRYINNTRFAPGIWIGFELDKADGEHNGTVNNIKYFVCTQMYGTFVKKSQIAQYIARDTTKSLSKNQLEYLNNIVKK